MRLAILAILLIVAGCVVVEQAPKTVTPDSLPDGYEVATFSGGCFWCVEDPYEDRTGIKSVISGFAGGDEENPEYREVASGKTGHREAVQVTFDPNQISYKKLLDIFWRQIDPTDNGGQFADRGFQYSTAIFYHSEEQKKIAEQSKADLIATGKFPEVVTPIIPFKNFYKAEEYHQDYAKKNPIRYKYYKAGSGRTGFLKEKWGDESKG